MYSRYPLPLSPLPEPGCGSIPKDYSHNHSDDPLWSSATSFLYDSPLVHVSLGRREWGPRQPVYGFNGIVQGAVKLSKQCTHVVRVEVSLLGRIKVMTSGRGLISEHVTRNLVTSSVVLSCPPRDEFSPAESSFPFSIPFPSHVKGGSSSLPPSYASWVPSFSCEIEYCIRVDVHRKGLRRHEQRIIPIMYLPKTWPSHPIPSLLSDANAYKTVSLSPVMLDNCPKTRMTLPTVDLSYPSGGTYSSGHSISLKLTIRCTEAPALVQLLVRGLEAHLLKRMVAWSASGQVIEERELVLSEATFTATDTLQEGLAVSYFDLTLGGCGKEQSWGINDVIEVNYLIQVSVHSPESGFAFLPTYNHVSRIGIVTEPWSFRGRGLLGFGGFSDPALGMVDPRLERRSPSRLSW
ncbi:hypothetical protein BC827DRAFT_1125085 [Russula dissimulans]|nr:hypothetical protein BC827DRAFT_1125085 [Russula dissimulans]